MVLEVPTCSRVIRSPRNGTYTLAPKAAGTAFPGRFVPLLFPFVMVAEGSSDLFEEVFYA